MWVKILEFSLICLVLITLLELPKWSVYLKCDQTSIKNDPWADILKISTSPELVEEIHNFGCRVDRFTKVLQAFQLETLIIIQRNIHQYKRSALAFMVSIRNAFECKYSKIVLTVSARTGNNFLLLFVNINSTWI